ncbi:MAG: helix-hairpin-helix domain-containing protein [Candidatus Omnitrophica bacterium]|nr:helix-hairpin-helix domain-containing protein [Candidatus Omnitrophota bacterium]
MTLYAFRDYTKRVAVLLLTVVAFSTATAGALLAAPKNEAKQDMAQTLVNVNTASAEELQEVRGIGPSLADRIIEFRSQNGKFQKVDDLINVRGIGEAKLQKIKNQISI